MIPTGNLLRVDIGQFKETINEIKQLWLRNLCCFNFWYLKQGRV